MREHKTSQSTGVASTATKDATEVQLEIRDWGNRKCDVCNKIFKNKKQLSVNKAIFDWILSINLFD